ncbi:hypothetical protein AMJ40_03225 [candidate division TA06 bacterium DG_26]|uniref:HEAT repeat domain-containing protein n=1 Tax=candidate division TA06 bacterium DG_26 TaxID=1703771 RepID=A0A0S7WJJ9_UNCT6|nr:MAG: hypothetical protein AMJ40_03225 [candidate division TA06 bacterium DG_26]
MDTETRLTDSQLDRETLAKARSLMLLTAKALRSMKVYPSNSPVIQEQKEILAKEFGSFLEANHVLTVKVAETNLLIGDQIIYQEETRSKSLAFLLYRDGLREISFYEGMTEDELNQFLDALAETWMVVDETDIVSALWEKDFSSIKYVAIDQIFQDVEESEDADLAEEQPGVSKTVNGESSDNQGSRGSSSGAITLNDEDSRDLKSSSSGTTTPESMSTYESPQTTDVMLLNDRELAEIKTLIENDRSLFNPPRELAEALLQILLLEQEPERYQHVLKVVEDYLSQLVAQGNFGMASQILSTLVQVGESLSVEVSEYRTLVDTVLERVRSPGAIETIKRVLRKRHNGPTDGIFSYLSLLGVSATPVLIHISMWSADPAIHSEARALLTEFARRDMTCLEQWLSDSKPALVRLLLYVMGQVGGEESLRHLVNFTAHPNVDVRKETIRALSNIGTTQAQSLLLRFLSDPTPEVRILALRSLDEPDPEILQSVSSLLRQREFSKKEIGEKKVWVDFLRKSGSDDAVPVLHDLLRRWNWFRKRETQDFKLYIISALGSIATESAEQVLLESSRTRNRTIRGACRHAVDKAKKARAEEQKLRRT